MSNFAYRVPATSGSFGQTPEQISARVDHTRIGLMNYLEARRERIGQSSQDMLQSPEAALAKQQEKIREEQRKLVDDYMQTRASDDTM